MACEFLGKPGVKDIMLKKRNMYIWTYLEKKRILGVI